MQDLNVTLIQTNQFWEDKKKNLAHFEAHLALIEQPTELIIFPEMFHTGFTMNAKGMAENMDGEGISWLKNTAASYQCAVVASLIIKEEGNFYNRMVFISPDGNIQFYDKRKLFTLAHEHVHYSAGHSPVIVKYKGWKIMLQVCYDLRFPELCRNSVSPAGAYLYDLLVYVANWPERRSHHWRSLLTARAIENQCIVAGVNRVGSDAHDLSYSGDSLIIDALGEKKVHLEHSEHVVTFTISAHSLNETRSKLSFLKDA